MNAMASHPVVTGRVVRDPMSGRLLGIELSPEAWRVLGVAAGARVLLETRVGDTIAAEVVLGAYGQLVLALPGIADLAHCIRTVRVRRPRRKEERCAS